MNTDAFVKLMERVENPGTFSVTGTLSSIPPGLKVKDIGMISLPIVASQANAIIEHCEQAPFGRGEDTIVDTSVRNVWQMSPDQFELTNPAWTKALQKSIRQMARQLGLEGCKIKAEAYKLLVYKAGSFFTAHRDTEKMPNMFATLVINLPSEHQGGELIISHGGQEQHYSFANSDLFSPEFVAFYADCYHEVKPVTAGYRVCLIYNLAIANRKKQPSLAQQLNVTENINQAVQEWLQTDTDNPFFTYLLEHSYSTENLRLDNLKNGDYAKASVLLDAAEKNDCQAFLCLVTYYRSSYGETPYYGRYYDHDIDESDFEEYDISDQETYAHAFITAQGQSTEIKKLYLDENHIFASIPLKDGPDYEVSISEATGNEGATKELWYHRGAVMFWPKSEAFEMLKKMDIDSVIKHFKTFVRNHDLSESHYREQVIGLAEYILKKKGGYFYRDEGITSQLIKIGNVKLIQQSIHDHMNHSSYSITYFEAKAFIRIVKRFGWSSVEKEVNTAIQKYKADLSLLKWLNELVQIAEPLSQDAQSAIGRWFRDHWRAILNTRFSKDTISNTLMLAALLNTHDLVDDLLNTIETKGKGRKQFITSIYGPAVIEAHKALKDRTYDKKILEKFIRSVCQWIEKDYPTAPEKPKDWSRPGQLNCDSKFCKQLNAFLPDPEQHEIVFRKALKREIVHIQDMVKQSGVDLHVELVRTPPKFQGNIHKTQAHYDGQLAIFNLAQKLLKECRKVLPA